MVSHLASLWKWDFLELGNGLNGESHNFSFFQIILDGGRAMSRSRKWKTSTQVSFLLPGNEVTLMEARL